VATTGKKKKVCRRCQRIRLLLALGLIVALFMANGLSSFFG